MMRYKICSFIVFALLIILNCSKVQEKSRPEEEQSAKMMPEEVIQDPESMTPEQHLEEIFSRFRQGNIVFNVPEKMKLDESRGIHLLLSTNRAVETLKKRIEEDGVLRARNIRVSQIMTAELKGKGFQVEAMTEPLQIINLSGDTEWRWQVTATRPGNQQLFLTLNAIVTLDGQERPHTLLTHSEEIKIYVTMGQRVSEFVASNWQWLWSAIVVPAAGWLWERKRKPRKKDD